MVGFRFGDIIGNQIDICGNLARSRGSGLLRTGCEREWLATKINGPFITDRNWGGPGKFKCKCGPVIAAVRWNRCNHLPSVCVRGIVVVRKAVGTSCFTWIQNNVTRGSAGTEY